MIKARGLTLIEVLIALAIIGIALTAIIKSTTQSIQGTAYLQNKMIAHWAAKEVMNKARLGLIKLSDSNSVLQKITMLNRDLYWRGAKTKTPNSHIKKIAISVYERDDESEKNNALASLEAYVDNKNAEIVAEALPAIEDEENEEEDAA